MFGHLKTPSSLALVIALGLGCSTPKETPPSDSLIGRPPPASEDPFYFVAMERAVPVESSGMVEADPVPDLSAERKEIQRRTAELEEREGQIRKEFERLGQERDQVDELSKSLSESRVALEQERQKLEDLRRSLGTAQRETVARAEKVPSEAVTEPSRIREVQCVACVSICPVINGKMTCPKEEDLVCGWGSHADGKIASELAAAECNGALRLMEGSKVYGEIGGECPRPSCKP